MLSRLQSRMFAHAALTACAAGLFLVAGFLGYHGLFQVGAPHSSASHSLPGVGWLPSSLPAGTALTAASALFSVLGVLSLAWSLRYSSPRLESKSTESDSAPSSRNDGWNRLARSRNQS